ncbi:MAG: carbohydrate binding family 9 domain-containing protein, partial [Longimicrobiales bacterium]
MRAALAILLVILGPIAGSAQTPGQVAPHLPVPDSAVYAANEPGRALKDGKVLRAFRIATAPPTIDGSLNDEVWSFAEWAGNYVQRDPNNGDPMTEPTRVQVAYDDRYLYIAILCADSAPAEIAAGLGRRDELPATDSVTIGFDPRHDHLTAYAFQTNPSAIQADFSVSDDDRTDREYNAVWEVRTQIAADGWMAEFRIPFSQMRFTVAPEHGQVWGFQAERLIRRKGEQGTWVAKPRGERGEVSLFGHLVFDTPLPA